jgi:hypothetical protein
MESSLGFWETPFEKSYRKKLDFSRVSENFQKTQSFTDLEFRLLIVSLFPKLSLDLFKIIKITLTEVSDFG